MTCLVPAHHHSPIGILVAAGIVGLDSSESGQTQSQSHDRQERGEKLRRQHLDAVKVGLGLLRVVVCLGRGGCDAQGGKRESRDPTAMLLLLYPCWQAGRASTAG